MDLPTRIKLSSGRILEIPILGGNLNEVITQRSGIIISAHKLGLIISYDYQPFTAVDMLEIYKMITGNDADSFVFPNSAINWSDNYYYNFQIAWIQRTAYPYTEYELNISPFTYNDGVVSIDLNGSTFPAIDVASNVYWNDNEGFNNSITTSPTKPARNVVGRGPFTDVLYYSGLVTGNTKNQLGYNNITYANALDNILHYAEENPDIEITNNDPDNIWGIIGTSGEDGGDGDGVENGDGFVNEIDAVDVPDLPNISLGGLIRLFNPSRTQLNSLAAFLWSDLWDVDTQFKKIFSNPMDAIIGLSVVPVQPNTAGSVNVKFGNVDSGISMPQIVNQWVEVDMGSVNIKEVVGSFLDYDPYVKISLYLPYIGMRDISADDVMKDRIHVVYHIDVLSGGCTAIVETTSKGVLYQFNGSAIANIPLTAINYSGAIQNAISSVISGVGVVAGMVTGAAPLTAMGAVGLANSAANTALNSKPTIERSGTMGGAAGLMSVQQPYIIIQRPKLSVPKKLNHFTGNTLNVTKNLGTLRGFTMVELIQLDNVPCTDNEKSELLDILHKGVIF